MDPELFADHLAHPRGLGHQPSGTGVRDGVAGGAACGDLVRFSVLVLEDRVADAGFLASGCGAVTAAGSAAVELLRGTPVLEAACVSTSSLSAALGGLSPGKLHAAELVADALHSALGAAVRAAGALPFAPERTLVAMSGGVDSAVAALLVARSGREAVGVTLELWRDAENDAEASCCSASAVRAARGLAHGMGLAHLTLDLRAEFRAGVVDPWLADHAAGLTPNPCVRCNGRVRLDAMLDYADAVGAPELATGHYARTRETPDGPRLRVAADPAKDQSYMLAGLAPASLARLRFPLGELAKPQVRALAADAELPVATRPDSQDLCFLAGTGKTAFLARHGGQPATPGPIVDEAGETVGRHAGHQGFTVGQRKGIGVAGPEPLYVLETDAAANSLTVGPRAALATTRVRIRDLRLHGGAAQADRVKLRYRSPAVGCRLVGDALLELSEPVDGAAPGQVACLMRGDEVVGTATIDSGAA